jgi:hypothetical protein
MDKYYKLAQLDGYDFRTGHTINYREAIGKTVTVPTYRKYRARTKLNGYTLCTDEVLHASKEPLQCFIGAKIPCSAYIVEGTPVVSSSDKLGFTKLKVLEEIGQEKLADLFGFDYPQAINPVHPLKLVAPTITNTELSLLQSWDSVRDSVGASVGASVWASVGDSVWASVGDSVWASVWDSVWDSVWASVGDSVRASVGDSVRAYIGSLFPKIKTWKYTPTNIQGYPYQSCVNLWHKGIVPSFDGEIWRLHTGLNARVAYEISAEKLRKLKF